jgi:N-acetylglucosaminyldiphosphoundecaprenol N-acetyl-beta-D-mannosaminyltransferase
MKFIDYSLYTGELSNLPHRSSLLLNTINQYSYCMAHKNNEFRESLLDSDALFPDGIAIVMAIRLLTGEKIKKVAGADVHQYLIKSLNDHGGSCFYLGSSEDTLQKIKHKMSQQFPNIRVGTFSPPFKQVFDSEDNIGMINAVNQFQPDVLFIGMTAPKQEQWAHQHKNELNAKIISTIGAAFDFYAGTVKRPGGLWRKFGLEWFIRMMHEPKRLWKRYLLFGPVFFWLVLQEKRKLMFRKRERHISIPTPRMQEVRTN